MQSLATFLTSLTSQGTINQFEISPGLIGRHGTVQRSPVCSMSGMFQEILAFILSTSGWVLVSSTLPTDYWKVSSLDGTVITTATYWSNLWKACVTDSTGVSNCKDFPSMLALDGQLFSLLTGLLGFIALTAPVSLPL